MWSKTLREELVNALVDYKFLLSRGYNQKASLDIVTSRYQLSRVERMLLFRCIHSELDVSEILSKKLPPNNISGHKVVIDGFNTLLTIVSVLEGDEVFLCDDDFIRDLRSVRVKEFELSIISSAAQMLRNYLNSLRPSEIIIILDRQVSKSGELRASISGLIPEARVVLANKADITTLSEGGVTSSSDYIILKKAAKVVDLAGHIVMMEYRDRVINLKEILSREIKNLNLININY